MVKVPTRVPSRFQGCRSRTCGRYTETVSFPAVAVPAFLTEYRTLICAPLVNSFRGDGDALHSQVGEFGGVSSFFPLYQYVVHGDDAVFFLTITGAEQVGEVKKTNGRVAVIRTVVFSPRCCSSRVNVL